MSPPPDARPAHAPAEAEVLQDPARLFSLHATGLLDSEPEEAFDRLTRLAARIINAPIATLSLVDDHRQFIKSAVGMQEPFASLREIPLSGSICKYVVTRNEPLIISDLRLHDQLNQNSAVRAVGLRAYAGIPVRTASGAVLGCFNVMDLQPREWTADEMVVLGEMAASVMTEIDLRTDIRRREAIEARLRLSEERFRTIVEAASDIVYDTDEWGRFRYVNPVAERVMGLPQEQLIGMHFTELVRADARAEVEAFYRRQFAGRIQSTYYEFPAVSSSGAEVWIGQNVRLLLLDNGRVRGAQAIARDMTHRRTVERMKDQFISVVSHELRTPLTAIRGSLGLLETGKVPAGKAQRMIAIAVESTDRLIRLVNDILDLERINSGEMRLQVADHGLNGIVQAAVEAVKPAATREGIVIELEVSPAPLLVDGDRIVQVIVHLLSNAIKFSPRDSRVRVSAHVIDRNAIIEVTDQGRGIPEAQLGLIFERFQQGDSSDSRDQGGTGLGLTISKSLIEQHGGRITVKSTVGQGSTFRIELPVLPR